MPRECRPVKDLRLFFKIGVLVLRLHCSGPSCPALRQTIARKLRSGTVGHNSFQTDFRIAFGGFKRSGIGREGGVEGLYPFLETKTVVLDGRPASLV